MAVDYSTLKKGGFMRQKQKNCFSLRLRTVGGHLSAEQLAKIAEVADKYGEGYIHLTSRQGVEIPFIRLEQIDEVKNALEEGSVTPVFAAPASAPSPPARAAPSAPAAASTPMHWHRRSTSGTLAGSYPISSSLASPAKRNRAFPTGNALLYISLSSVVFGRVRPFREHPVFVLRKNLRNKS